MSTFLQIAQDLVSEPGISGDGPFSVEGQVGLMKNVCKWIVESDVLIQLEMENWNFMWQEWELTFVDGQRIYSPPDILGLWDRSSFCLNYGTANYTPIEYVDYLKYRDKIASGAQEFDEPTVITTLPNHKLAVFPIPAENGTKLKADFWAKPVKMVNDADVSRIPEHFHRIILVRAKMMYAAKMSNQGLKDDAYVEYMGLMQRLKSAELPNQRVRASTKDIPMITRVV